MEQGQITGFLMTLIAGACLAAFPLPFKFTKNWAWENNWILFTIGATLVAPLIIALFTVPGLFHIYSQVSPKCFILVFLCGAAWGFGAISYGLAIDYLGIGLGMAIMMGLINSLGSLLPIAIYNPSDLLSPVGILLIVATVIILAGILCCAYAGSLRNSRNEKIQGRKLKSFKKGLFYAISGGVLGPMINFIFIVGKPIKEIALNENANPAFAGNTIWVIGLFGGFVVNFAYCVYLLNKNKTWKNFFKHESYNWGLASSTGWLWYGSVMFYGMAVSKLGAFGASIGWAMYKSLGLVFGNVIGIITKEWKDSPKKVFVFNTLGITILVIGIFIIAFRDVILGIINHEQ